MDLLHTQHGMPESETAAEARRLIDDWAAKPVRHHPTSFRDDTEPPAFGTTPPEPQPDQRIVPAWAAGIAVASIGLGAGITGIGCRRRDQQGALRRHQERLRGSGHSPHRDPQQQHHARGVLRPHPQRDPLTDSGQPAAAGAAALTIAIAGPASAAPAEGVIGPIAYAAVPAAGSHIVEAISLQDYMGANHEFMRWETSGSSKGCTVWVSDNRIKKNLLTIADTASNHFSTWIYDGPGHTDQVCASSPAGRGRGPSN